MNTIRTRSFFAFCVLFVVWLLAACGEKPIEITAGIDYKVIETPLGTPPLATSLQKKEIADDKDRKIEVVDVFWYGCNSCFRFRDKMSKWREQHQDEIIYLTLPAPLNPIWTTHARIYLAARQLHIPISDAVYDYLHVARKKLYLERDIGDFFAQFGIDRKTFTLAYKGKFTNNQIEAIRSYLAQANIRSVPALIIDGRFVVLENNDPDHALKVASALIYKLQNNK